MHICDRLCVFKAARYTKAAISLQHDFYFQKNTFVSMENILIYILK